MSLRVVVLVGLATFVGLLIGGAGVSTTYAATIED